MPWGDASPSSDFAGNRVISEVAVINDGSIFIQSEGRVVAAVGLDNLLIIDTPDALLVADRARAQDVKKWCNSSS